MAYRKPTDLDGFIQLMPKADMRVKALLAEDLVTFLSDDTNSIVCMDMGLLVDGLMPWLTGSHFKIAQKSLEAFSELIKRLGPDFNAYNATVLPHVIDRLGDSKDTVREKAQLLLQVIMEYRVLSPQVTIDKLAASCFKHKNAKVREEFLQTIVSTLNEYGTGQLTVRMYIQPICSLLGDPTATVRDAAIQTLVEIYKHVGDRLRVDLRKMDDVPATKLAILEQKFDQIKAEGLLLKSAMMNSSHTNNNNNNNNNNNGVDDTDNVGMTAAAAARERPSRIVKRTVSARSKASTSEATAGSSNGGGGGGGGSGGGGGGGSGADPAGSVNMEIFEAAFEQVPQLNIFHPKDMDDIFKGIQVIINDKNADWEKRIDSLKRVRSLLLVNFQSHPNFTVQLKDLSISFLDILKEELRSQVIREACITIAYLAKTLRNKLDSFCFTILEQLINLMQNSAKVIASSSTVAVKYIIKYTHAPKIIKIITDTVQHSKSKDIRATLCEVMCLQFEEWQTKSLERYAPQLRDALKRSISDADNDARKHSRRAYWLFRVHFPDLADQIYNTLDIPAQRALERERDGGGGASTLPEKRFTTTGTTSRIARSPGSLQKPAAGMRSVSAVDTAAVQRAKARAQYSLYAKKKPVATTTTTGGATGSLPRPRALGTTPGGGAAASSTASSNVAAPRVRGRTGVSQSQPGSRSTSPSSKLRDQHGYYYKPLTGTIPKKASGIPRSLASSRETSPTRAPTMKRSLYQTGSAAAPGSSRRTPERSNASAARTLGPSARMLQQSREAENTLADALSPDSVDRDFSLSDYGRAGGGGGGYGAGGGSRLGRKLLSRDESDAESEASSVCSERSFDSSMTRGNNSNYSLSGSRNRLDWSCVRAPLEDIDTIIFYCASTHWSERKDGLISLTQYLAEGKDLMPHHLQCVLDLFRKLFLDTHTKVYSLFLDTVTELILVHANDLHEWLFILLTRLFNKLGTELLNSMTGKIWKTLQVVHEYFPTELQMNNVLRILSDAAQTPCTKTKIAILKFLTSLATTYCKNSDFPSDMGAQVEKAVLKIVQLSGDQKSLELRGQARLALIALYNLNTPQMTKILANLPKGYQDSAKSIIQNHLRRNSTSGTNSPSSPLGTSSPKALQSPSLGPFASLQPQFNTSPRSRQSSVDHELYSEGDVQHNIHKTSEEIRNCFGTDGGGGGGSPLSGGGPGPTSSTSARPYQSLVATNGYNGHHLPHDGQSQPQSATTTESNTPESTTMRLDGGGGGGGVLEPNCVKVSASATGAAHHGGSGGTTKHCINYTIENDGEVVVENGLRESEIIRVACTLTPDTPADQLQTALDNLGVVIKNGNCELPNRHFKAIMKMLLSMLNTHDSQEVTISALHVLGKIVRSEAMKPNWINYLELILLNIINCYQNSKEMARQIDMLLPRMVPGLPLNSSIHIVNPVIATGAYPLNLCAVKLLTELADQHSGELTELHLDSVFPNLARLTDFSQSMVRKAAVFCIVKLYLVMGEDRVKPKLSMLNPSKVRLLNVYIEKQRSSSGGGGGGGGGGGSTKNSSASSAS